MSKLVISLTVLLTVSMLLLFSMKVPSPTNNNTVTVKGTIENIYEGGIKDVVFKLKDDDRVYYINRGLENKFELKELKEAYIGRTLALTYINHNHIFKSLINNRHLSEVKSDNSIIYSEM